MADIIDGKAFAESLRKRIASETARIKSEANVTPGLADGDIRETDILVKKLPDRRDTGT